VKISVILPNYNHADLVGQSIEAVLKQTHQNLELIVVDDGSTDNSRDVISGYLGDNRLKPVFLERNRGVNGAQMEGLAQATGELFFGAGADDYLCDPDFFQAAVKLLKEKTSAAGVFARSRVIDKKDDGLLWAMGAAPQEGFVAGQKFLDAFLRHQAFIPGSSVLLRLELLKALGGFDHELGPQSDYFVNHALAASHGIFFLNREIAAFRVAPTTYSATATDADHFRRHALVEKRLREYAKNRRFDPPLLSLWRSGVVNGRYNLLKVQGFYDAVSSFTADAPEWERRCTPREIIEAADRAMAEFRPLKEQLDYKVLQAYGIFEEVAGPLDEAVGKPGGAWELIAHKLRRIW
jgi:glycosyltransferase involved in cell wall biosynthesis